MSVRIYLYMASIWGDHYLPILISQTNINSFSIYIARSYSILARKLVPTRRIEILSVEPTCHNRGYILFNCRNFIDFYIALFPLHYIEDHTTTWSSNLFKITEEFTWNIVSLSASTLFQFIMFGMAVLTLVLHFNAWLT